MLKGTLKGIVFDLDGTLVDSLSATFDAFNHGITRFGGRMHSPQEIMKYFGPGEGEIFSQILGPEKASAAYRAAREYTDANLNRIPLHAGVSELLAQVEAAGVPVSIVTGRSWETTELILRYHNLSNRFVTVVANDHVASSKPSPEGIQLALRRMKLRPEEICYVGDSHVDIQAAHRAGSKAVAALWDLLATREGLAPHSPHHWAETPAQVWDFWLSLRQC